MPIHQQRVSPRVPSPLKAIITSPSLDPTQNVSGISTVTQFIIDNNTMVDYVHFELGRKDKEKGGWRRIPAILGRLRDWRKMLKRHPNAIIHYNFPLSTPSILRDSLFMFVARRLRRKMLIHVHGGVFLTSSFTPWILERIMLWVFADKNPVIVLSESERNALQGRFRCNNIHVLPNCIDLSVASKFKREFADAILEVGYLGRIAASKGMTELLEACKELKQQHIPFRLHIAGKEEIEGQYLPAFKEALGDNFVYEGIVSGDQKTAFLQQIDTFILPSYFEGLPMSLLEAMSFASVPITTMVGSIASIVEDGQNGIAITTHTVPAIVDAVKHLLADNVKRRALSTMAKQTIFSRFSPEEYTAKLNSIYNQL